MKNTKLVWRLKEQPTSENLRELVKDGILSKDEAREILFSSETEEDRDKESLKSEIKFLRELIEKLATHQKVVEVIRGVENPYWRRWDWYNPYIVWCDGASSGNLTIGTDSTWAGTTYNCSFSGIKTF